MARSTSPPVPAVPERTRHLRRAHENRPAYMEGEIPPAVWLLGSGHELHLGERSCRRHGMESRRGSVPGFPAPALELDRRLRAVQGKQPQRRSLRNRGRGRPAARGDVAPRSGARDSACSSSIHPCITRCRRWKRTGRKSSPGFESWPRDTVRRSGTTASRRCRCGKSISTTHSTSMLEAPRCFRKNLRGHLPPRHSFLCSEPVNQFHAHA